MYDSTISVNDIVNIVENEVDISSSIGADTCARWISSLEQLLYADLIRFYRTAEISFGGESFDISAIPENEGEAKVIFDDIVKIYDGDQEIVKSGAIAAYQFENDKAIYWQDGNKVQVRTLTGGADALHVIYKVRPRIKTDISDTVKVPYEWLDMVISKVRGEVYKLAGDDAQAAKWLNDYNSQLESFKAWIAERQKWFGE